MAVIGGPAEYTCQSTMYWPKFPMSPDVGSTRDNRSIRYRRLGFAAPPFPKLRTKLREPQLCVAAIAIERRQPAVSCAWRGLVPGRHAIRRRQLGVGRSEHGQTAVLGTEVPHPAESLTPITAVGGRTSCGEQVVARQRP
jgi:hypothetical protein